MRPHDVQVLHKSHAAIAMLIREDHVALPFIWIDARGECLSHGMGLDAEHRHTSMQLLHSLLF